MKRRFRLLKDSHSMLAGAIVEEKCDDGFVCITPDLKRSSSFIMLLSDVVDNPEWFEEIEPLWVPANLIAKAEAWLRTL